MRDLGRGLARRSPMEAVNPERVHAGVCARAAPGVMVGIGGVFLAGRLIASLLFELAPTDPLTIAQAAVVLVSVAAFAGYLPARRAARVDPLVALQDE